MFRLCILAEIASKLYFLPNSITKYFSPPFDFKEKYKAEKKIVFKSVYNLKMYVWVYYNKK